MELLKRTVPNKLTERVLQFGEGNFLRGFFDWMIDRYNKEKGGDIGVVAVQPLPNGMCEALSEQDGLYTLYLRGLDRGQPVEEKRVVECITRGISPYGFGWRAFMSCAENPSLRFVVSNTTESGIEYIEGQDPADTDHITFPARMALFLKARHDLHRDGAGLKGFIFLPCELIDGNGSALKECILRYAREWNFGQNFTDWVNRENIFCNTLVDRIATGYPRDEAEQLEKQLGYRDQLIDTAEFFHLWVIEGGRTVSDELPLSDCGINVIWTNDVTPYKRRKVRVLNGAHTMMVSAAMLCGLETVREAVEDPVVGEFLRRGLYDEIIPTLTLPREELLSFADDVIERFKNPYIRHRLASISLNSVSKFAVRVLPSILSYRAKFGALPPLMTLSLASLIVLYGGGGANDMPDVKAFMETADLKTILAKTDYWGSDLSFMLAEMEEALMLIDKNGMREAIRLTLER